MKSNVSWTQQQRRFGFAGGAGSTNHSSDPTNARHHQGRSTFERDMRESLPASRSQQQQHRPPGANGGIGFGSADAMKCYRCDEPGHFARECPNNVRCRKCGTPGHREHACTYNGGAENGASGGSGRQHNRGARDSTSESSIRPAPRATFVPEVVDEHELFTTRGIAPGQHMAELYETDPEFAVDRQNNAADTSNAAATAAVSQPRHHAVGSFQEANLLPRLLHNLQLAGCHHPTGVQRGALPAIIEGKDVIATAPTGSGKTLSYVLPIIQRILSNAEQATDPAIHAITSAQTSQYAMPLVLILCPTRELVEQVAGDVKKMCLGMALSCCTVYGGVSMQYELDQLLKNPTFIIATMGRLKHYINDGRMRFDRLKYLVLDECDKMLEEGFEPEVRRVVQHHTMPTKTNRQTIMMSATFPDELKRLAHDFLREGDDNYVYVQVGRPGLVPKSIRQQFLEVRLGNKMQTLIEWLRNEVNVARETAEPHKVVVDGVKTSDAQLTYLRKVLVFVERKRTVDFIGSVLSQSGIPAVTIHGDRVQMQREQALSMFRSGQYPVLVASAVLERGLDICGVDNVLNFDLPHEVNEYVHRIGRTGRVGNDGTATSFFDPDVDQGLAPDLVQILCDVGQPVPDFLQRYAVNQQQQQQTNANNSTNKPKPDSNNDQQLIEGFGL